MTMKFGAFVTAYNDGTITKDAAWRAYDIEHMSTSARRAVDALKAVELSQWGEIGYTLAAEAYGISTPERAKHLLRLWYTWERIASGKVHTSMKLRLGSHYEHGRYRGKRRLHVPSAST